MLYVSSMEKEDFRTVTEQARVVIRKKAILLILSGKKKKEVAVLFGVKNGTITDWFKSYKSNCLFR